MKTCSVCERDLPTSLNEFGSLRRPVCFACYMDGKAKKDPGPFGQEEEEEETTESLEEEIEDLESEIEDLQNEISGLEDALYDLRYRLKTKLKTKPAQSGGETPLPLLDGGNQ